MNKLLVRARLSPLLLAILVLSPLARAVDPIDFLESLKDDDDHLPRESPSSTEYPNGVNVIPGEADINYPTYSSIPKSSFSCKGRPAGFYANTELRCQVWHICDETGVQQNFLCTNGTVYSQDKRVCDWWYNVNCDPEEVNKNYLQNYDLYKGPPPSGDNQEEDINSSRKNNERPRHSEKNDFGYEPTPKSYNKDPFSQFPSSRKSVEHPNKPRFNENNEQQYKSTPSYNEPFPGRDADEFPTPRRQPSSSQSRPATTTYRPSTTYYTTPPPPAALQGSSFPPQAFQQHQQQHRVQTTPKPQQKQSQSQQQSSSPPRSQPQIKTSTANGKRIVEIRVPISQIPPEILAKYGKRIPENILKEIFLNFTRGKQQELQKEAIESSKPSNPTGAGNARTPPPKAPIPQNNRQGNPSPPQNNRQGNQSPTQNNRQGNQSPPQHSSKKPVDYNENAINEKKPVSKSPPPPPPPAEYQSKFRHSTPRKVDGVRFATPTKELLAEYEDERQQVGESQNPIYSLHNLFNQNQPRTAGRSKAPPSNDYSRVKESFDYDPSTSNFNPTTPEPVQEYTRSQPRRRTQAPRTNPTTERSYYSPTTERTYYSPTTTVRSYYTPTTNEPELITDRYFPVSSPEQKKTAELRRILLVAQQGIKVLPPIPFLSSDAAPIELPTARRAPPPVSVTQRPKQYRTTTAVPDFSKIPPVPKVAIPEDYYVQNERFEEAESRYPRPSAPPPFIEPQFSPRQHSRPPTTTPFPTTTRVSTTTYRPSTTQAPFYQEPLDFRRAKATKSQPPKKKPLPPPERKKQDDYSDYDDTPQERFNTEELELLRLAQEYIDLTGQDFGVRQSPRNA